MYAARGYRYYLSNTHLCVSRDAAATPTGTESALAAEVVAHTDVYGETWGRLQTNITSLAAMPTELFGHSATYQAYHGSECVGGLGAIDLMPYQGGSDRLYLAISDSSLFESEPEAVLKRREIVELGYVCAGSLARYERAFNLHDFDCNNAPYFDYCRQDPSLPYRASCWQVLTQMVLSRRGRRVSRFGKNHVKATTWMPSTPRRAAWSRPRRRHRSARTSSRRWDRTARASEGL